MAALIRCWSPSLGLCTSRLLIQIGMILFLVGCEHQYEIELKPAGDQMGRQLTVWRERSVNNQTEFVPLTPEELAVVAESYGAAPPAPEAKKHTFSGQFRGRLPSDVGGYGTFTHWSTELGSVSCYVERFRGNDDLSAELAERQAAANRLIDLIISWFEQELRDQPEWPRLREFLHVQFRHDLINLGIYTWSLGVQDEKSAQAPPDGQNSEQFNGMGIRVLQYFAERGYFTLELLPVWLRALQESEGDHGTRLVRMVQRLVADRMGVPAEQPIPDSLAFLSDRERTLASLNKSLSATREYQRLLEEWQKLRPDQRPTEMPQPYEALSELLISALLPNIVSLRSNDRLVVRLAATQKPLQTNGDWDAEKQRVTWKQSIPHRTNKGQGWPTLLYAVWVEPNAAAQTRHFGQVRIDGEKLLEYCWWRKGLSADEGQAWEKRLATITPQANLKNVLSGFRFPGEPLVSEQTLHSQRGTQILVDGVP